MTIFHSNQIKIIMLLATSLILSFKRLALGCDGKSQTWTYMASDLKTIIVKVRCYAFPQ